MQVLECVEVLRDILTNLFVPVSRIWRVASEGVNTCGVWATSGLNGLDALRWESFMPDEKFLVLPVAGSSYPIKTTMEG